MRADPLEMHRLTRHEKRLAWLEIRARRICGRRGHAMLRTDKWGVPGAHMQAHMTCTVCGAWVQLDTAPTANGIDMGGPALALECPSDPKWL